MAKGRKRKNGPSKAINLPVTGKRGEDSPQRVMEVQAPREKLQGGYSNFALIHHTRREFVIDFIWRLENYSALVSRVITSPEHARELHVALGRNIERYQESFGEIATDQRSKSGDKTGRGRRIILE